MYLKIEKAFFFLTKKEIEEKSKNRRRLSFDLFSILIPKNGRRNYKII